MKYFLNKLYVPKKVIPTVPKKEFFIVFPYLGTMSSNSKQKLRICFEVAPRVEKTEFFIKG